MSALFSSFKPKGVTLRKRIAIPPMCQYRATDGVSNDWQWESIGSRPVGNQTNGFRRRTPVGSKSAMLRVTTVRS